jgi:hypothetical protein
MTCPVEGRAAPAPLFRLGYGSNAWGWPPWQYVGKGRWDDPEGDYRILYASTERFTTFIEVMGDFATDAVFEATWLLIEGDDDATPPGEAPTDWLRHRSMGRGRIRGHFAAASLGASLRFFQQRVGPIAAIHGVPQINAATVREKQPREITQAISRLLFNCKRRLRRQFRGVQYFSRHGDDFENWAIFEPCKITEKETGPVNEDDPDYQQALRFLGLSLPSGDGA